METLNNPEPLQQQFSVPFTYSVQFTRGLFKPENDLLFDVLTEKSSKKAVKVLVVVDDGLSKKSLGLLSQIQAYFQKHQAHLELVTTPLVIPGGEQCKNSEEFTARVQQQIHEQRICRHSYVVAVGGGALLDMVGYAAATAHRGVRLIRVPTTVLSQNDSGVGVKNGINAFGKKNFLGSFSPPYAVLNDFDFLNTLGERDWRSGIAEAIKVALIKDPQFFEFLEQHTTALVERDEVAGQHMIYECARAHLEHIRNYNDPFEQGSSRPLDFGHWAAHKLEQMSGYALRHGEAVAMGIALDSVYSQKMGMLSKADLERILTVLSKLGFQLFDPLMWNRSSIHQGKLVLFEGMDEFQEHLGGELTIMLLQGIGSGINVHHIEQRVYKEAIDLLSASSWDS